MDPLFEERLSTFLVNNIEPFELASLLRFLGEPVSKTALEDLADYLHYNQLAYLGPSIDGNVARWISRAGLFTGKTAVLAPTRADLTAGVILPASCLVPIPNPVLLPHEYTFRYRGVELSRVMLTVAPSEIYPAYSLFGEEYAPQYLSCDNSDNERLFSDLDYDDPIELYVTAFDAREIYWNESFTPGDRVLARLADWKTGTFDLSVLHAADIDRARETAWVEVMDASLKECFSVHGPSASIDEQLAFAWYLRQDELDTPHAPPFLEYLDRSTEVSLEYFGVETRLWFSGVEIPAQETWSFNLSSQPTSITEEALANLGLPLNERIIESYVLDGLFRREPDCYPTIERLLPTPQSHASIAAPLVERAVRMSRSYWDSRYNRFSDYDKGKLRGRLIKLHADILALIQSLRQSKIRPGTLPDQWAIVIMQIMGHLVPSIESLDFPSEGDAFDIDVAWDNLEGMEEHFQDAQSVILSVLPILINRRFSIIHDTKKHKEYPDA